MSEADHLLSQANNLAAKIQRQRQRSRLGPAPDGHELAAMESRLASLWTAIRAARATGGGRPDARPDRPR